MFINHYFLLLIEKDMVETGFGEKIKGFLVNPVETFQKVKDENLETVLKYFVVLAVIFSILWAIIFAAKASAMTSMIPIKMPFMGASAGGLVAVTMFIGCLILLIIRLFIGATIVHIFVHLLGGGKGYTQTVKAIGYGMTPSLLLGWIPFIGIIAGIWALIVKIIGIRELQEMSTGKAVLAIILPLIIIVIVAVAIFMYVSGPVYSTPPYTPPTP